MSKFITYILFLTQYISPKNFQILLFIARLSFYIKKKKKEERKSRSSKNFSNLLHIYFNPII